MSCLSLAMRHSAILVLMSILLSFELFHVVFVFEMLCKIGKVGIALVSDQARHPSPACQLGFGMSLYFCVMSACRALFFTMMQSRDV